MTTTTLTNTAGQIEHIDPNQVEFEDNIRTDVHLDPGFLASIREHGVLLPVLARRDPDTGTVYIRDGQRRTLAARDAGQATIPAYLAATSEDRTARITAQLVTNDRREGLGHIDRAAAYQQLTLDGLSVAKIAKATGEDKATVQKSLTVAGSESAKEALARAVSLDRAILIAEFEGDLAAIQDIEEAWEDDLEHTGGRLRHQRALNQRREQIIAGLAADGIPETSRGNAVHFYSLTDAAPDAEERPPLDAVTHQACEGRAVLLHVYGLTEGDYRTEEVCTRPDLHYRRRGYDDPTKHSRPVSEEEAEARKADRRRLIANNKAWDAAEPVRRAWITTLLTRKALPKDAHPFTALTLTRHAFEVANDHGTHTAAFLGLPEHSGWDAIAQTVEKNPARAAHVSLAVALSAREARTSRESWRTPDPGTAAYLTRLEAWGYRLSAVERIAAGHTDEPDTDPVEDDAADAGE